MIESLNLSLSSACGADCIFCPSNRGRRITQKVMPFETAKKLIDDLTTEEFRKNHTLKRMEVGENGDAFMNKDLIKVLRYIREKLPDIRIILHTNFQLFTKEKAEILLGDNLVDRITCNIDGSNKENYFNVKRLDYDNTKKNLEDFLETRKRLKSKVPLRILVLTLNKYINTIYNNFKVYPQKVKDTSLKDVPDDFKTIKNQLKKLLDFKIGDGVVRSWMYGWAEREQIDTRKLNYKKYTCPNLIRLNRDMFVAPDGTLYACCLDPNNELVLGNIHEKTVNEIYFGEKRKRLLELLKNGQFEKVGGPCRTVNCCQLVSESRFMTTIARLLYKKPFLLKMAILARKDTREISAINIKS